MRVTAGSGRGEVGGFGIKAFAADDIRSPRVRGVVVDDGIEGEGPDVAVAVEAGEAVQGVDELVESLLVPDGRALEAEVVVVKLDEEAEGLVEVAASSSLYLPAGSQILVGDAHGKGEAAAYGRSPFVGAVWIVRAVVVVGAATVAAAGRPAV